MLTIEDNLHTELDSLKSPKFENNEPQQMPKTLFSKLRNSLISKKTLTKKSEDKLSNANMSKLLRILLNRGMNIIKTLKIVKKVPPEQSYPVNENQLHMLMDKSSQYKQNIYQKISTLRRNTLRFEALKQNSSKSSVFQAIKV